MAGMIKYVDWRKVLDQSVPYMGIEKIWSRQYEDFLAAIRQEKVPRSHSRQQRNQKAWSVIRPSDLSYDEDFC